MSTSRPGTPIPSPPLLLLPANFMNYLLADEIPIANGPLAPPRGGTEIRKCIRCKQVYLLVHYTSSKQKCGFCTRY